MKYRLKPSDIGIFGTVFYKVQVKKWWGWSTIAGTLSLRDATKAINELSPTPTTTPVDPTFRTFNINDYVWVKLTDYGRGYLFEKLGRVAEDKNGWSKWSMWSLMETLGSRVLVGSCPPFEPTIRFELQTNSGVEDARTDST